MNMFNIRYVSDTLNMQKMSIDEFREKIMKLKGENTGSNTGNDNTGNDDIVYIKTNLDDFRSNSDDKGLVDYTWQNTSNNESVLTFNFKGKNIELDNLPYTGEITARPVLDYKNNIIYGEINTAIANSEAHISGDNKYKINFNGKLKLPEYSAGLFTYHDGTPSYMQDCKEIDLAKVDMNNIVNASFMFYQCYSLTSLNLSSFTGEKLVNTYCMFYECRSLSSLNLSKFTGENLVNAYGMFSGCYGLTSLSLPVFTGASLENASSMFDGCEKLTSLSLPVFTGENLTNAIVMFDGCEKLTSLTMNGSAINTIVGLIYSRLSLDTGVTVDNDKTYRCTCTYDNGVKITEVDEYVA